MTEGLQRKISTIGSQVTSVISVALVLLIIGVVLTTAIITGDSGSDMRRHVGMVVKMYPNASATEIRYLDRLLKTSPYVKTVEYISAENVLAEERSYNGELLNLIGTNPYSAEFEVYLQPEYLHSDSIYKIARNLELQTMVDEVYSQPDLVDNINEFISTVNLYLIILGVLMLIISVALIYNTVGMSVYTRRFVINTMKLVGATDSYIRRPFVTSGIITGAAAAAVAFVLLLMLRAYSATMDHDLLFVVSASDFIMIFVMMLLLGVALCAGSVYMATNRYLRSTFDELIQK